jgi:hypothetical protein
MRCLRQLMYLLLPSNFREFWIFEHNVKSGRTIQVPVDTKQLEVIPAWASLTGRLDSEHAATPGPSHRDTPGRPPASGGCHRDCRCVTVTVARARAAAAPLQLLTKSSANGGLGFWTNNGHKLELAATERDGHGFASESSAYLFEYFACFSENTQVDSLHILHFFCFFCISI